ncbi:MAG: NAD-dependent 4,6-dehydratase LegB [Anaerolineales bacterium]|nr:NAD-dependent 4,6-dehydratase LegB [Anaerolineales bacterium]
MGEFKLDWHKKKVLVTGAGGFIGSHLTEELIKRGAVVRGFVHYNALGRRGWLDYSPVITDIEVLAGDIADRDSVRKAVKGVEVIFHLAALIGIPYSYQAPASYVHTNINGTLNVLQSALDEGVQRVVHTSTSEAYGTAQYVPIDEEHPLQGQSPYSATKIGADKLAESYYRSFGLPVATIRPFNTYGPRQSARAVIPTIITQALTQDKIKLGNLAPTRDLNFVADTVDGFISIAESPGAIGEVINIGTGREISIGDLANTIFKIVGRDLDIEIDDQRLRPDASEVDRLCADITKAKEIMDWAPRVTLETGLQETISWIKDNLERYRPGVYFV